MAGTDARAAKGCIEAAGQPFDRVEARLERILAIDFIGVVFSRYICMSGQQLEHLWWVQI